VSRASNSHAWSSLSLGDAILAFAMCEQIKDEFRGAHAEAGLPLDMAVFTRLETGNVHCSVTAYFTPGCSELAARLGAVPCPAPARIGLELLAGVPMCWNVVFAPR